MSLISTFLNNLYEKLNGTKIIKISIYCSLSIFLLGLLIAVIIAYFFGPEGYNIIDNYVSDLGSINYTPTPFILDIIAMITAFLLIPIFFHISTLLFQTRDKPKSLFWKVFHIIMKILVIIGFIFFFLASIGLFGVGLFSEDRTTSLGLHFIFSVIVFGAFGFAAIFNGIVIILKRTPFYRSLGLIMLLSTPSLCILFIINPESLTRPFIEWMMLFSIFLWIIPLNLIILRRMK